jgi:exodeoxyribonuclease-3
MRIATYNVNGINGRLGNLLGWLDETALDIVCLQELKAPDEKFPAAALRAAGYGAVWHGQKSWNGVAILARGAEPEETRRGLPGDPDDAGEKGGRLRAQRVERGPERSGVGFVKN